MDKQDANRGVFYILAGAVLWGTTGTTQALAPALAHPMTIGAMRLLLGGLAMFIWARRKSGLAPLHTWPVKTTFFAGVMVACYQFCFFSGVKLTGVAVGTVVGIGSAPIAAGVLGLLINKEKVNTRWIFSTILAIAGCCLLVFSKGDVQVDPAGLLLALGAGISYAGYTSLSKKILALHPPDQVMAVIFCIGAVIMLPLLFFYPIDWIFSPKSVLLLIHLGIIATAAAYALFARGLKSTPVGTAVTLSLAEPMTAALLGIFFLNEPINLQIGSGIALIFSAVFILSVKLKHAKK